MDIDRSLYHTFSEIDKKIPINLGIAHNEVCWNQNTFNFYTSISTDTFINDQKFSDTCSKTLYSNSNKIGVLSIVNLIKELSDLEKNWYSSILDTIKLNFPNSEHSEIYLDSENENLINSFESKILNGEKHVNNYTKFLGQNVDEFNIFKYNLIGINKECFMSEDKYDEIFGLGLLSTIYTIEEYSIGSVGLDAENIPYFKSNSSNRKLERKLSNYVLETVTDEGVKNKKNILMNFHNLQNSKLKKTIMSLNSLSDLHTLASKTFKNLYIIQTQNEKVFLALAILSGLGIIFLAFSEYDYRVSLKNKCSKFCYGIFLGLIIVGVIICTIIILISQVAISKVIGNSKDNLCIDSDILGLIEGDLILTKLLIPISIGLAIILIVMILGLALSCRFCGQRWKYRIWTPIRGRFM